MKMAWRTATIQRDRREILIAHRPLRLAIVTLGEIRRRPLMGWVKREDGSWLVFDDDLVSESSWEFVQGLKGGGDEHMSYLQFYRAKKGGI